MLTNNHIFVVEKEEALTNSVTKRHYGGGDINYHQHALRVRIIANCIITSAINVPNEVEHGFENPPHVHIIEKVIINEIYNQVKRLNGGGAYGI